MKTVKLSFSILSNWSQGRFEEAIAGYLGKPLPEVPYFELGKLKHQIWANHIQANKTLPPELGGDKLINPIVEQKWQKIIPFSDEYQILLRGVIDLEDELPPVIADFQDNQTGKRYTVITDHKCTIGSATSFVDKIQLDYYKLLRPEAKLGKYICHNPYKCDATCKPDNHVCYQVGVKFLDQRNAEQALEHIITFGGEMIQYLVANKLIRDYKYE